MAPFESTDHGFINSTDDIEEGTTNQYFTQARAQASFSVSNRPVNLLGDQVFDGQTYTNGGLHLANGTITYIPPNLINLSAYATLDSPVLFGTPTVNGSNIQAELSATNRLDAAHIADGTITNAEFQTLNNVSSNIQSQLNLKANYSGDTSTVEKSEFLKFNTSNKMFGAIVNNLNYLHSDRQVTGVGNDNVYVYGCYIASTTSDDRLKHNEAVITSGLSVARRLVPLTYDMTHEMRAADYKGPVENPSKGSGFIAQALLQIPELAHAVMENPNPETIPYRVNYAETIAYAFAAIKELDALVQTMRNEINELKNKASN